MIRYMDSVRTQIDTYLQEMLKMQFRVSDFIEHKVTKGELREKFIHQMVLSQFPNIIVKSGILCSGNWQSSQGDFIWLNNNARVGDINVYDLNDCKMFMEIKSCAKASELNAINDTARNIKDKRLSDSIILVGMFCYSTTAKEKTILRKFGFKYDKDIDAYTDYTVQYDVMKNVDFLFSLNIEQECNSSPYFIIRDYMGNCTLYKNNPVIQYFFQCFNNYD